MCLENEKRLKISNKSVCEAKRRWRECGVICEKGHVVLQEVVSVSEDGV